jgi:Lipopolysaccharide-assembly
VKTLRTAIFSIVLLSLLGGCGYSRAGRSTVLIQGRSLHLAMFANRTYQPNIEAVFRKALLNELAMRGENISPENGAELIVAGELESAAIAATAFSSADKAMMYSLTLTATLQVTERQSGRVIWKAAETLKQEYPATADLGLQRNNREAAISALCARMAKNIAQKMDQAF